jgi:rubrerythrin
MDQSKKDKMLVFFEVCARIESMTAELYHYYSELFQENEDVSQLWKKTALEEENHMRQFELAIRLCDDAEFELEADIVRTHRIFHKLKSILEHVRTNPPDMETAFSKAIEMEEYLASLHMDCAVRYGNESIKKMFQSFSDFDQDHVKALKHQLAVILLPKAQMVG